MRLEPGVHELRAELEPALLPGEFVLDLGVHDVTARRSTWWSASSSSTSAFPTARERRTPQRARLPAGRNALGAGPSDGEARYMRLRTPGRRRPSVLFAGQSYYHAWYLSRELRKLGWRADVLNWDLSPDDQGFYHGQDFSFSWDPARPRWHTLRHLRSTSARSRATTSSTSPTPTACGSASRCMTWWRNAVPSVRGDRAAQPAGQEDRVLEQRVPRRRLADLIRILGRHAGMPRLPVA